MDDFRPPPGGDSRGKAGHACSHAKDRDRVKPGVVGGSNVGTPGCINLA